MLNNKRGFTLIELLVAIAIIGILAGILITGMAKAKQKANQARAWQSFNQIALAMQLYYDKNNSWPLTVPDGTNPVFVTDGTFPSWDASWYCSNCVYRFGYLWSLPNPNCAYVGIFDTVASSWKIWKYSLCITSACANFCGLKYSEP